MKRIQKLSIIMIFPLMALSIGCRSDITVGITGDKIKAIYIGMPLKELVDLIGVPYAVSYGSAVHSHDCRRFDFACLTKDIGVFQEQLKPGDNITQIFQQTVSFNLSCCEANIRANDEGGGISFQYTKPVKNSFFYPMIWVGLCNEGLVRGVVVKEYMGRFLLRLDSIWIYHLFSHSEYIDEKRFNRHLR